MHVRLKALSFYVAIQHCSTKQRYHLSVDLCVTFWGQSKEVDVLLESQGPKEYLLIFKINDKERFIDKDISHKIKTG